MAPPSIVVDASNAPTGTEPIAGITSLNRDYQNLAGQVIWHDSYTNLDGVNYSVGGKAVLSLGSSGIQFDRSVFTFDSRGRKNRITSPAGVITRTDFDGLGRATGEWVGTNDGTSGDMTQVSKFEYDGGLVGNGTLTALTLYPGNGATPRVTRSAYDWRSRLIAVKVGDEGASELTSANRPINYFTLNNLGELTDRRVFDGDGVVIVDANGDGIPDRPADSLLRSKNSYSIDGLGQVYREEFYGVNSATGALTTTPTVTQYWFSGRGERVKTLHPGGFVEKFRFDGAGRLTGLFGTDGGGDGNAVDARTLTGDLVLRQSESSFDVDGHLIQLVQRDRYFGESGTGPLGDSSTTGTRARVGYTAFYYDGAGRRKADVEIGTNAGVSWTRPANPPASSNTALVSSYGYDSAGRLVDATDPSGAVMRTTYDMQSRQVSGSVGYGAIPLTTAQTYANGRLATVTEPGNRVTRVSYDPLGRTVTASERNGTSLARNTVTTANALGDIISVVDAAQMKVTFGYDAIGRKLNIVEASETTLARTTWMAYDTLGRVIAVTDPRNFTTWTGFNDVTRTKTVLDPLNHSTIQTYDLEGRQISLTDARGYIHGTSYDLLGRVTTTTSPLPSSQTATTQQQYLVGGDTNRTIDPLGHAQSTTFDRFDRVSKLADPLGNATQWAYDRNGRVVTITDPKGTQFATDYDLLGRTIQTRDAVGTAIQQTATFTYDATNGDLNSTTDYRGAVTTFGRDTAGRLVSLSKASNTSYSFTTTYAYDALDRVVTETRPGNRVTTQTFDVLSRKTSVREVSGTAFKETKYGYDAGDNLTDVTDALGKITFHAYNGAGQRWAMTDRNNATTQFLYDNEGRTIQVTDAGGNATYSVFDEAGRQYAATDGAGKTKWFVYDAADRRTSWADRNGRVTRRAYDDANRVTAESWELSGVTIQTQTFAYDANGNTTSATDPDGNHTLTYDALNRVVTSQQPFSFGLTYAYSPTGDTVTMTDTSGGTQVSSFDKRGRLTTREQTASGMRVTFGYDSNGDRTTEVREGKSGASWVGAGSTLSQFDGYGRVTLIQASTQRGSSSASIGRPTTMATA